MKAPLKIHLCWFPGPGLDPACVAIARELYEFLHRPIADDPVQRPGLEIPVEYGRDLESLLAAGAGEVSVGARVVVALLDAAAYGSPVHRATMKRAVERWSDVNGTEVLFPVVLDRRWHGELKARPSTIGHDAPRLVENERLWHLPSDVAVAAGRALLRTPAALPHVLISHTSADTGATQARQLADHIKTRTRIGVWHDEVDIDRGGELAAKLAEHPDHAVVVVVRTDRYSESAWCGLELLAAKRARVPIVTLLATADGEPSPSAYGGNHRTMVWKPDRCWEVIGRCVQAWLHSHHFVRLATEALAHAGLPADSQILARRPELIDLAMPRATRRIIVYPDPPLTEGEATLLRNAYPSFRLLTPNTMLGRILLANDPVPPLAGRSLAISLSHGEDLPTLQDARVGNGLVREQLWDGLATIVLAAMHSGARLAFGGSFQELNSNAVQLAEMHRSRRRLGNGTHSQLECYLTDDGPPPVHVEYEPVPVLELPGADRFAPRLRHALRWMAMRHVTTVNTDGRIVLGGQMVAAVSDDAQVGYRGAWPGVLEECARSVRARKAVYIVGGFGGVAGLLAQMLTSGQVPGELRASAPGGDRRAALLTELDPARGALVDLDVDQAALLAKDGGGFADIETLASWVLDAWRRRVDDDDESAWNNGLSVDDNRRLFRSADRTEIAHLVFSGLHQISRPAGNSLSLSLYHGDIVSVGNVDGYAVATVPELPPGGAAASLDTAMSGRLSRGLVRADWNDDVALLPTETDTLAGRQVVVARLALPSPGSLLTAEQVEERAFQLAQRASDLESLAVAPFGVGLGLSHPLVIQSLLQGIRRGRGPLLRSVVICEADRSSYQAFRGDLLGGGVTFRELREGPQARPTESSVVLQVDARENADNEIELEVAAYAPDGGDAVVPSGHARMRRKDWDVLRAKPVDFRNAVAKGQALRDRILSASIRALLAKHEQRRVVVLANKLASGLPWELLQVGQRQHPAVASGMVRRIKLAGEATPPADRASSDGKLRVLLVVNPFISLRKDLPDAAREGDVVAAALTRRGAIVERIDGKDATLARVQEALEKNHHDVLHYAGHARFNAQHPEQSGLQLAGGEVLTSKHFPRGKVPHLVVLSACESARVRGDAADARTADADALALAEAILRAGVTTMIGTFFAVDDPAALAFASALHTALAAGQPVGSAVRDARRSLYDARYSDWGNFLLYGDDKLILL